MPGAGDGEGGEGATAKWGDENIVELGRGGGCTRLQMCYVAHFKTVNFCSVNFASIKNKAEGRGQDTAGKAAGDFK